jgi:hypothetical protein
MMDYQRRRYGVRGPSEYEVGTAAVPISGSNGETAFRAFGVTYVRHETPVAGYLARLIRDSNRQATLPRIEMLISVLGLFDGLWGRGELSALETDEIRRYLASRPDDFHAIDTGELVDVVRETNWSIFDTWAWRRAGREVDI